MIFNYIIISISIVVERENINRDDGGNIVSDGDTTCNTIDDSYRKWKKNIKVSKSIISKVNYY